MSRRSATAAAAIAILCYVCRFVAGVAAATIAAITVVISSAATTVSDTTILDCNIAVLLIVYLPQISYHILQQAVLFLKGI